jgi:nicotinate-nucleotide adenylyltransferase
MNRRIGLLGGTFDPPHLGHLVVAEVARVELDLDEVHFVVAGAPWMKRDYSDAEHRVAMVEHAVADHPRFTVDRSEVDRPGITYTVDTLRTLAAAEPDAELVFLLGEDAAAALPEWKEVDGALVLARFVVLSRPGFEITGSDPRYDRLERLEVPPIGVSSTDLRARFREGGAVRYQTPAAVVAYIREHGLYGTGAGPGP